jgi:DNA replication protein DnaC
MLKNPTIDKLVELKLHGMAASLREQSQGKDYNDLTFEERLGIMLDTESIERQNRVLKTRLTQAKLRLRACVEDIDYRARRGLDKALIQSLSTCGWIHERLNIIITGPCGVGKSFLACAMGHRACMNGLKVFYVRSSRLMEDLALAKGDGRYLKLLNKLSRTDLLIIDDWGLTTLGNQESQDLLEILEDRHDARSTIITSQLPVDNWHEAIKSPTLADAILDRIVHNAYKITLTGESMRKKRKVA